MSDTHANAFRLEADEKRKQAADLLNSAEDLEAQAELLDPAPKPKAAPKKAAPKKAAQGSK